MGTPQMRWREIHQSGRVATMFEMRSSPQAGSHFTFLISSSARLRSGPPDSGVPDKSRFWTCWGGEILPSIVMNHCSVARKMRSEEHTSELQSLTNLVC